MQAVENKIRLNSQGWEDARIIGERQVLMVVAYKGQLYLLPEHRPAKFENIDNDGLHEAGCRAANCRLKRRFHRLGYSASHVGEVGAFPSQPFGRRRHPTTP